MTISLPDILDPSLPRVAGKRGRKQSSHASDLQLKNFRGSLPSPPPASLDNTKGFKNWLMLGNDQYGDCGPAATEHIRMVKALLSVANETATFASSFVLPNDTNTETLYFDYGVSQGEPGPNPDQGVDNKSWLTYLFNLTEAAKVIKGDDVVEWAFAELDASNPTEIRAAVMNYSCVLIGCALSDTAETEFENGQLWTISASEPADPQNGHDVVMAGWDANGEILLTWGAPQRATVAWETGEESAGDLEAWVLITKEDAERNGVDLAGLQAQIRSWGGTSNVPAPGPAPAPPPAATPPAPGPAPQPAPPAPRSDASSYPSGACASSSASTNSPASPQATEPPGSDPHPTAASARGRDFLR